MPTDETAAMDALMGDDAFDKPPAPEWQALPYDTITHEYPPTHELAVTALQELTDRYARLLASVQMVPDTTTHPEYGIMRAGYIVSTFDDRDLADAVTRSWDPETFRVVVRDVTNWRPAE